MSTTTLQYVTSRDGTRIGYDRLGDGPPVVLVSGGSVDRSSNAGLAEQLATGYTVFNFDRRGRGPSGDTQPYAVEREIEDLPRRDSPSERVCRGIDKGGIRCDGDELLNRIERELRVQSNRLAHIDLHRLLQEA